MLCYDSKIITAYFFFLIYFITKLNLLLILNSEHEKINFIIAYTNIKYYFILWSCNIHVKVQ